MNDPQKWGGGGAPKNPPQQPLESAFCSLFSSPPPSNFARSRSFSRHLSSLSCLTPCTLHGGNSLGETKKLGLYRESQRDVVCLCWPMAPSYTITNTRKRGGGGVAGSTNEYSCAHHVTCSPNKLGRANSIFNLWIYTPTSWFVGVMHAVTRGFFPNHLPSYFPHLSIYLSQWLYITLPSTLFNRVALFKSVITTSPFIILCDKFPRGTAYFFKFQISYAANYRYKIRYTCLQFSLNRKPNSWTHNFFEVSGHNLESSHGLEVSVFNVYITN